MTVGAQLSGCRWCSLHKGEAFREEGFHNSQICISMAIQNSIKLTMKIKPYTVEERGKLRQGDKNILLDPPEAWPFDSCPVGHYLR